MTAQGQPTNSGVGFSIPINLVKRIVPFLIRDGAYTYPYLGISATSDLSLSEMEALGLATYKGAYVLSVVEGGPADQGGLKGGTIATRFDYLQAGGDLITAFDGKPVDTYEEMLSYLLATKAPGETAVLTVLRDGQPLDITVTLGERP
jgi:2-alkenal reductase